MNTLKTWYIYPIFFSVACKPSLQVDYEPSRYDAEVEINIPIKQIFQPQAAHDEYIENACWTVIEDGAPSLRVSCGSPQQFNAECNRPQLMLVVAPGTPSWMGRGTPYIGCYNVVIKPILKHRKNDAGDTE